VNTEVSATSRRCERFSRFECCTVGVVGVEDVSRSDGQGVLEARSYNVMR